MLEARGLTKCYAGTFVLRDVSFILRPGDVLGYLGPNGSGKTTTVGILTGMTEATAGSVWFDGAPILDDLMEYRRQIGYVSENAQTYPFLSGQQYLELIADLRDMDTRIARRRIAAFIEIFGLNPFAEASLESYSKGMRQRILLASALLHNPRILIFDEPESGFDAMAMLAFRSLLGRLARLEKGIFYCSHDLDAVERACSRVLVLNRGHVVAHDTVDAFRERYARASLEGAFRDVAADENPERTADELVEAMQL